MELSNQVQITAESACVHFSVTSTLISALSHHQVKTLGQS